MQNSCSCNQESPNIISRCPMSRTSASKSKLSRLLIECVGVCKNLKEVLTTRVPPSYVPPSACDMVAFVFRLRVPIFFASFGFTTGPEAAVSITASARIPPFKQTMTVNSKECLGLVPMVGGSLPSRFPTRWPIRCRKS